MTEIQSNNEKQSNNDTNEYDELVKFLSQPESKEIIKNNQPKLDQQNLKTTDYLNKNIENTRDKLNITINT